jgi:polysaccharide biosynthesis protein PslJ
MTIGQGVTATGHKDSLASSVGPTEQRERTPWLLAFLCFLIPALPASVVVAGPLKSNGSPAKMIAVLFFALTVLGFILIRRTALTRTLRPGIAFILLFFLLNLVVYGVGLTHVDSALAEAGKTRALIGLTAYTGLMLYVLTRVVTTRQRAIVLGCLAIGLTFACVVGLLQRANVDLRYIFQPPGFVDNADYSVSDRLGVRRVWGTAALPLEFAVLAAVTVPLTIHFARYAANRRVRWLAMLACGVALFALPAGVSRSGVVALAAALLVYMWNFKVRALAVAVAAGAAAVLGYIAVSSASANALWQTIVNSREDPSILTRTADYARVGDTFRAHPVFGLGLGSSDPLEYGFLDNEWLQQIVQGGTVALTAMIVLAAGGILGISAALRTASTPCERDQAYMIGSIFVGLLASSFTMDLFSYQQATFILLISVGLLWSNFKVSLPEVRAALPRGHYRLE